MSQTTKPSEQSQKPLEEELQKKADEQANANAEANSQMPADKTPEDAAADAVGATGETEAQLLAKAIDVVAKMNPNLPIDQVLAIVASAYKKVDTAEGRAAKEVARLITPPPNPDLDGMVYLKKDKKKQFPIHKSALETSYVVRQTYKKKTEEGDEVEVAAKNLNEIAIYTKADFDRMSLPNFGFEREGVIVDVWHKPGDTGTVQSDGHTED